MVLSKMRSLAAVGGLVAAGAALAGCGGGSGGSHAAGRSGSTTTDQQATTTVEGSASTLPTGPSAVGTRPSDTAPATTVPTTAPSVRPPATTLPASPSTGAGSKGPVLIVRSADGSVSYDGREPSSIGFSGDSTNIVTHLTWSSWGPDTAVGHGLLGANDCQPNCAEGHVTEVPATIDLASPANGRFTAMSEKAGSIDRSYSYPSNWATSAS